VVWYIAQCYTSIYVTRYEMIRIDSGYGVRVLRFVAHCWSEFVAAEVWLARRREELRHFVGLIQRMVSIVFWRRILYLQGNLCAVSIVDTLRWRSRDGGKQARPNVSIDKVT
jgi:hypothetical protein